MVHIRRARAAGALGTGARENHGRNELHAMAPARRPGVAEANDQIVGFVASGTARDDTANPLTGEVYAIYVLPDCWDRGVGRTLLAHAEHDLLSHGYADAVLWVLGANQRARTFYEMAGWPADGG